MIDLQKIPILAKKKIIFSDEACIDLGGYVNKQNCRRHTLKLSLGVDVFFPSRSCGLTPLDCYFWDAVKDKCYVNTPDTIKGLKDNIREAIA